MRSIVFALLMPVSATAFSTDAAWVCNRAERELEHVQSWGAAYKYYRTYGGGCADGALAEGLSGQFTMLLDRKWKSFPQLTRLVNKDRRFLDWILLQSFYDTENEMAQCRIRMNLRTKCSVRNRWLCEKLDERVGSSEESMRQCEFNSPLHTGAARR
jgi:hypothetical protein